MILQLTYFWLSVESVCMFIMSANILTSWNNLFVGDICSGLRTVVSFPSKGMIRPLLIFWTSCKFGGKANTSIVTLSEIVKKLNWNIISWREQLEIDYLQIPANNIPMLRIVFHNLHSLVREIVYLSSWSDVWLHGLDHWSEACWMVQFWLIL